MSRQRVLVFCVICTAVAVVGIFVAGLINAVHSGNRPIEGALAPDFRINLYDEYRAGLQPAISLSELKGKVVVLNFWASWCVECRKESDMLEEVWRENQTRGLVVIGVDYLDTEAAAYAYLKDYSTSYANGADIQQTISRLYRITGVPETFIIDKTGTIRKVVLQAMTRSEMIAIIGPLLNE